jgi:putative flippase GtrA
MIVRFGFVSGMGWLIDFCLFSLLIWQGTPVSLANIIGASIAVLFVFFVSVRHVFEYKGGYLVGKLLAYIVYQILAILAASLAIGMLTIKLELMPIIAKIIVTPLTFYANFQFMSLITTGKLRLL